MRKKILFDATFLASVTTVIGLVLGYFINDHLNKQRELLSEVNNERREVYQLTVNLFIEVLNTARVDSVMNADSVTTQLYEIYKKSLLYASPGVINSFGDFMQVVYHQDELTDPMLYVCKMTSLMGKMRADLGLNNDDLGDDEIKLIRVMITDFDNLKNCK